MENIFIDTKVTMNKGDIKTAIVKIPHLRKKLSIECRQEDSVIDFIANIQRLINSEECNFGIFIKNQKGNIGKFISGDTPLFDILQYEHKLIYMKMHRTFPFESPKSKKLEAINSKVNQNLFVTYIRNADLQGTMKLLQYGFDPNYLFDNEPPIHYAVVPDQSVALITLLLSQGSLIEFRSSDYQTVLHKAVRLSKPEAVKIILEFGLNPNFTDFFGLTPLYYCVLYNTDVSCLELLLNANARRDCVNECGMTMLHQASFKNNLEQLKVLLHEGEDINEQSTNSGNTALHFAVLGEAIRCYSFLLDYGADADIKNKDGITALEMAERGFHTKKTLVMNNEKYEITCNEHGDSRCDRISEQLTFSCVVMSDTKEGSRQDGDEVSNEPGELKCLRNDSQKSAISLFVASPASPTVTTERKEYFGLQTKVIEFERSSGNCFGFCLETKISDYTKAKKFITSRNIPSIHRLCRWKLHSSMNTLFAKPFLLEVNGKYVGNMPLDEVNLLIKSIQTKVNLRITNGVPSMSDSFNDMMDVTSFVSSVGKQDDASPCDQESLQPIDDRCDSKEVWNVSDLKLGSPDIPVESPYLFNQDNDKNAVEIKFRTLDLESFPSNTTSEIFNAFQGELKEEAVDLNSRLQSFDIKSEQNGHYVHQVNNSDSTCDNGEHVDRDPYCSSLVASNLSLIPLPQYGLHRTKFVLPLKRSLNRKTKIHIPLEIN